MQHYSMVFNTTTGTRRTMRISNPKLGLPTSDIETAIGQMIANDIFDPERGGLESLNRMELTTVGREMILQGA
jgi:hypothetical protein